MGEGEIDRMITKVYDRLRNVLALIIKGYRVKYLVETKHEAKWQKVDLLEENGLPVTTSTPTQQICLTL